jgi:hypothetical protein
VASRAIRLLVGAALAAALGAIPAASAAPPIAAPRPPVGIPVAALGARVDAQPAAAGLLAAQGSGIVSLQGKLIAYGRILGPGLIVIRDPGGDAVVRVNGRLRRIPRSGVLRVSLASVDADGSPFYIYDPSGLQLRIMAVVMDVAAAGHGRATLDGDGNYSVNASQTTQSWADAQEPLELQATSPS